MSTRANKFATGKPFSIKVSDAIRFHLGERKALESKRKRAFEDRDNALAELNKCRGTPEADHWKVKHSDAVLELYELDASIKWHTKQVAEIVEKADDPQMELEFDVPAEAKFPKPAKKPEAPTPAPANDTRPVGRPGKSAADPARAVGVDEHLAVSVNELDMRDDLKGKLNAAGVEKISQLVLIVDDPAVDLVAAIDCSEAEAKAIKKALKSYRSEHRQAARDAEGSAAA